MNETVALELKLLRVKKNIDLSKVAVDNGVSYETMRRYEKGQTNITIEFLEKMLNYYNADPYIFFKNLCENMHENKN